MPAVPACGAASVLVSVVAGRAADVVAVDSESCTPAGSAGTTYNFTCSGGPFSGGQALTFGFAATATEGQGAQQQEAAAAAAAAG